MARKPALFAIVVFLLGSSLVAAAAEAQSWPSFQANHSRTGQVGCGGIGDAVELWRWERPWASETHIWGHLAYGEGAIFAITWSESMVYAVEASNGSQRWTFDLRPHALAINPSDSVIVAAGLVFVGLFHYSSSSSQPPVEGSGSLLALDAYTGQLRWKLDRGTQFAFAPTFSEGTLYVGNMNHGLLAVDAVSGTILWEFALPGSATQGALSSPVVADGRVYFSNGDPAVYAVDATTGHQAWRRQLPVSQYYIAGTPAYHDGRLFVGSPQSLVALDASDGHLVWGHTLDGIFWDTTIVTGGMVVGIVQSQVHKSLVAFEEGDGTLAWERPLNGGGGILSADGTLVVSDNRELTDGRVLGLIGYDRSTGEQIWDYSLPWVAGAPIMVDGVLYGTSYLIMFALDLREAPQPSSGLVVKTTKQITVGAPFYIDVKWPLATPPTARDVDVFLDGAKVATKQVTPSTGCERHARLGPFTFPSVGIRTVEVRDGAASGAGKAYVVGLRWGPWTTDPPQPHGGQAFRVMGSLENLLDVPAHISANLRWHGGWLDLAAIDLASRGHASVVFDVAGIHREGVYLMDAAAQPSLANGTIREMPTNTKFLQMVLFTSGASPPLPPAPPTALPPPTTYEYPAPPTPMNTTMPNRTTSSPTTPGTSYSVLVPGPDLVLVAAAVFALVGLLRRRTT